MAKSRTTIDSERQRLQDPAWRRWGPYLSDRSWGTVREDDSSDGNAWKYFTHDQARSRAYRWGEDGIAGISDDRQLLCLAVALWNGKDPILKERLFGLDNSEGNHGEDAKEYWFHLDALPSHASQRMLYKYPQGAFPYDDLVRTNAQRGRKEAEYELVDTGIFKENRYWDVEIEYAKGDPDDICCLITVTNRGPEACDLHVLPQLWFRNTWSWGPEREESKQRPRLSLANRASGLATILAEHDVLGDYILSCDQGPDGQAPEVLFTENESNAQRLWGRSNSVSYVKDGIDRHVVAGESGAVNPDKVGTKCAAHYQVRVAPGASAKLRLRLNPKRQVGKPFADFDGIVSQRRAEADDFYARLQPASIDAEFKRIQRRAWAGMLWSKQWFAYGVPAWQRQGGPEAEGPGRHQRNRNWHHFEAADVVSMPDKWEYPWFAAWDLGFHAIALAYVDPGFAKEQLLLMVSERYQHPNGAVSAYEWNFDDVNPPVLARAAWRVYDIERQVTGVADKDFLEVMFQKLALNFAWWVNRKDASGNNIFGGGFLGLDNIGVFDRSSPLPTGGHLEQSDGTSWMAMFSLDMGTIAAELAHDRPVYGKMVVKYMIHFMYVARSMNNLTGASSDLWDNEDGFYYDLLKLPDAVVPLKVRSMVGLIPLFATAVVPGTSRNPELMTWMQRFVSSRPLLMRVFNQFQQVGPEGLRMLSLVDRERLQAILRRMLDESEFLSDYGIRALSRVHAETPYVFHVGPTTYSVGYLPGESDNGMFGGNSNWRGPIWMPVNYFLVTALRRFHRYFGDGFTVEYPVGSGQQRHLGQVADDISRRLVSIFTRDSGSGRRPVLGGMSYFQEDPHWRDHLPFYEYFHGDDGSGIGASHQTGWTGLVAALIQELGGMDPVPMIGAKPAGK